MNITKEQLPVQQFERLSINKNSLHHLPKEEMHALLSGYPSNMKTLTFKDKDGMTQKVNAKLSIYQGIDGIISLKVHPFRRELKNDMNLTQQEIDKLKSGLTIIKALNRQQYLVQLDQSINELRRIKVESINVAGAVGRTGLSENQKADLKSGKAIYIKDANGRQRRVKLDLTSPSGISLNTPKQRMEKSKTGAPAQNETELQNERRQQEHLRLKR
jgi:hypothetical protein